MAYDVLAPPRREFFVRRYHDGVSIHRAASSDVVIAGRGQASVVGGPTAVAFRFQERPQARVDVLVKDESRAAHMRAASMSSGCSAGYASKISSGLVPRAR
jgi:hypothetical protein